MPARSARKSTLLIILGAVLVWTALVVGGAARGIIRPDPFARRVAATLSDPRVAGYVAARITDAIIAQRPNLVSVRSLMEPAVAGVVSSAPFRAVVRTSARAAHRSLFESIGKNVVLSLPDVSVLVRGALANINPELAAKIPPGIEANLASPRAERAFTRFINAWALIGRVLWIAWAVLILGVAALVASIWVAPDRQNALVRAGAALFVVALALIAVLPAGRIVAAALTRDATLRGVIHGLWVAYFGPVKPLAIIAGSAGVVFAAAGSTMLEAVDPLARAKALWRWLTAPLKPPAHVARAILLLAAGAYAAAAPGSAATALVAIVGLVLVYLGLREVFRLVLAGARGAAAMPTARSEARAWRIVAFAGLVLVVGLGGAALLVFRGPPEVAEAAGVVTACNGSPKLCDRRVDQVVFPGAHNAMSNAEIPGWLFPHHNHAFPRQLQDGVRALLIDVHYGVPAEEHIITDFNREGSSLEKIEGPLGPEATQAAVRIRNRFLGHETGPSGLYFCHGFCELGAYPVVPALEGVRDFLVANPGEVVVISVEDYVAPVDLARAFEQAGLLPLIYTGPITPPLPTLRELIDWGQRLMVFTESGKPGVPWLYPAWESMQETPYSFHKPADFSCKPNRGPAAAPLFQINNWIETTPAPRPSNAAIVNSYDALLARARQCRQQRGHLPNILAVDFYDVGDLFRVVRTLNGLDNDVTPIARAQ
ncbi:MAG TPA: hypothetical protein VG454_15935 [Gemmatimonadales bacterium]|nr:hypothetical protein [Gemmatimonadales bacterium]